MNKDRLNYGATVQRSSSMLRFSSPMSVTIVGALTALVALAYYQAALSMSLIDGAEQTTLLGKSAYATLIVFLAGLAMALLGGTRFFQERRSDHSVTDTSPVTEIIRAVLRDKHYFRIFALSALAYGIFFALMSSTFVYQPGVLFSDTYGVGVPSVLPVICCGSFGQMPQIIVYVTQNFAILLIPVNLVLLVTVSWLVGLNVAMALFAYRIRPQSTGGRWFSGLGAIVGLFTACPTCAGFFFLTTIGLTGLFSAALVLSSLQIIFVAIGIPMLALAPLLTSRRLMTGGGPRCAISQAGSKKISKLKAGQENAN